jgi:hypothetical protein
METSLGAVILDTSRHISRILSLCKVLTPIAVVAAAPLLTWGQTRDAIIEAHISAFNMRDVEKYLEPLDDSVKLFRFPDKVGEKSKAEVRIAYSSAFNAKELGGTIKVWGKMQVGDIYIVDQSLVREGFAPVDQYVLYRFRSSKIIEIHYLPKNFTWWSGTIRK